MEHVNRISEVSIFEDELPELITNTPCTMREALHKTLILVRRARLVNYSLITDTMRMIEQGSFLSVLLILQGGAGLVNGDFQFIGKQGVVTIPNKEIWWRLVDAIAWVMESVPENRCITPHWHSVFKYSDLKYFKMRAIDDVARMIHENQGQSIAFVPSCDEENILGLDSEDLDDEDYIISFDPITIEGESYNFEQVDDTKWVTTDKSNCELETDYQAVYVINYCNYIRNSQSLCVGCNIVGEFVSQKRVKDINHQLEQGDAINDRDLHVLTESQNRCVTSHKQSFKNKLKGKCHDAATCGEDVYSYAREIKNGVAIKLGLGVPDEYEVGSGSVMRRLKMMCFGLVPGEMLKFSNKGARKPIGLLTSSVTHELPINMYLYNIRDTWALIPYGFTKKNDVTVVLGPDSEGAYFTPDDAIFRQLNVTTLSGFVMKLMFVAVIARCARALRHNEQWTLGKIAAAYTTYYNKMLTFIDPRADRYMALRIITRELKADDVYDRLKHFCQCAVKGGMMTIDEFEEIKGGEIKPMNSSYVNTPHPPTNTKYAIEGKTIPVSPVTPTRLFPTGFITTNTRALTDDELVEFRLAQVVTYDWCTPSVLKRAYGGKWGGLVTKRMINAGLYRLFNKGQILHKKVEGMSNWKKSD